MKTTFQLVIFQLIAALILISALIIVQLNIASQQLQRAEQQAQTFVQQWMQHSANHDGAELGQQLRMALPLSQLHIQNLQGQELFQYRSGHIATGLSATLLNWQGVEFSTQHIGAPQHELQVRYQLDHSHQIEALNSILWLILLLTLVIYLLFIPALLWWQHQRLQQSSRQLNKVIEQLSHDPLQTIEADKQPAGFEAVVENLQVLAQQTMKKFSEMSANARQVTADAYKDVITGLPNRNRFVQYYEEQLSKNDKVDFGIFAITRCTELQSLNQTRGYQEGDKYIQEVCQILTKAVHAYADGQLFRLNSSDFGVLLPRVTAKEAENFAIQLQSRLNQYQQTAELESVAYTGLVSYESGRALGELLAIADTSISLAQTKQANAWHLQKESSGLETASYGYGNQNWRNVIDDVLANNRLNLLVQSIQPAKRSNKAYSEILVRFKTQENQVLPTASFLAMAEKLDRIIAVDRLIIETALSTIKNKNMQDQYFGLNLSPRSVHDDQFVIWLERRLLKDATIASKLIFEVTEFGLQQNLKTSKRFIDMVHRAGARVTVEKFGVGITSFKFFRDLKPDYIKMDGSYTRHIDEDKNNQYFLRLMIDLAHRIGVSVFAESVETQEEKHMLDSLFVDGCQGYYIGKPAPL
ncbi:EAL domain-containing protein [Alkalimonas amylolytica]|uniref:Diguanylate cyclase (GGDEF) domain-containing protein n=1 Tax=Alkalimonas amylolytica TaxID=152573 RepID=A0A1H4B4R9_ALKAM|nr:GGDEF domain-containing protein [Alkalimonas amylolytica]SEA43150.1 diguanylate cyclase (GGDEF) domain-containing protein [Alkalimonas amylolytica]